MTRTTVQNGGTQVYWEPSDEIKVFFNGSGARFVSQNTENVAVATFTGTINVIAGANEGVISNYMTWGLYPYRADATSDGSSVTTTLPSAQTGRAGSFAKNAHITLAQSEGLNLSFYNVTGGLRFSLTQEGIKRVTFEGNNGESLAGKIKLVFADGIPVVQEVSEAETVITLAAPGGGTFQTGQWYYISAITGKLSGGYKMTFYKESESAKLISSSSVTIKRGIFGSLADADEDLVFKPTGGGDEPNPNDCIQFADPVAKYACVEKFDTNGDGEVSYAEAATATTLDGLFANYNTVVSFDEIEYFTSVKSLNGTFAGCTKLTHITIPNWITSLSNKTFQSCSSLETVVLPASLTSLPNYCFDGCSSLHEVMIPDDITSIPNYCFQNCSALTTVALPSTVTTIGSYAFSNCSALVALDLPSSLNYINSYAFQRCGITSMVFPASLISIAKYAFYVCTSLTSITLPSCNSLGSYAFSNCSKLSSVVLPDNLTTIPDNCFQNCTALATIAWPQALTSIGESAFDQSRFEGNDYTLELPSSVIFIGNHAFGKVRHLIIPSTSPVSIGAYSFWAGYTILYVPSNMVEMYKVRTNWSGFADYIRPISDYPVDLTALGGTVGEAVDIGLSVKWASWNVGASAPEEYGGYFAWGETEQNWAYDWDYYKWCDGSYDSLTKYNWNSGFGRVDNRCNLSPEDDAAYVQWGGSWRMPSDGEWTELRTQCSWEWTSINGINGYKVKGPNNNNIFLPAAGYRSGAGLWNADASGYYWSYEQHTTYPYFGWSVTFGSDNVDRSRSSRAYGYSIRPVCN